MSERTLATKGPVLIIGTGLLGTSIALALRSGGVEVYLRDASPTAGRLAQDLGAGTLICQEDPCSPRLVIVSTPPDVADVCVVDALLRYPQAVVTDVASVKSAVCDGVFDEAKRRGADIPSRYVGSHPMAGRERSGAGAADADLFYGRPWVIVPNRYSTPDAVMEIRSLAVDLGAFPIEMDARTHDQSVALISHVPQLVSSMLAARLVDAPLSALSLSGQGLRDTTRIAASDPRLWTAILAGNAGPVVEVLREIRGDLDDLIEHLDAAAERGPLEGGSVGAVHRVMDLGNRGVARIPGKHGGAPTRYAVLDVFVPDTAGSLGRLVTELGEIGVNIEDLSLEHSAGAQMGVARISLDPSIVASTVKQLEERGWNTGSGD